MASKGKILILPYTHTFSHLSRPLIIARELRSRGYEIIFAGNSRNIRILKDEGFPVEHLWEPDPGILFGNIRNKKIKFASASVIQKMIDDDQLIIDAVRPDLVLTDGRFSAMISTQFKNVRHAAIVNTSSTEFRANPYFPIFERTPSALKFIDSLNVQLERILFDSLMGIFKRISHLKKLNKTVTATNCLTGVDLTLMADIPEYFPAKNLPASYHYIGPLTWKSGNNKAMPGWWKDVSTQKPLIYITMGTTGHKDFFPLVREQFLHSQYPAVMTTGGQVDLLESVAGKFHVEAFLDGDTIMDACDLVVCHGGNGTIYQALEYGKPVIGIPTLPDQEFNMRRVVAIGAGTLLNLKDFFKTPGKLIKNVDHVTGDRAILKTTHKIRRLLEKYDAGRVGADKIEMLLGTGPGQ